MNRQQDGNRDGRINTIREWLSRNKIFFETIATSSLSIMAILVSVAQTRTATDQTNLLTLQTRIAEAQALPQFELAIRQKLNDATGKFDDDQLIITNRGGAVHEFNSTAAYFITVSAGGAHGTVSKRQVAVSDYFTASFISPSGTGELVTMIGNRNNAAVVDLARFVSDAAQRKGLGYGILDEQLVVRLQYRDLLNRPYDDYYEVRPVSGGIRLSEVAGQGLFQKWIQGPQEALSDLHADDLLKSATGGTLPSHPDPVRNDPSNQ